MMAFLVIKTPIPSGFPPGPIGGIIGHGRPSEDHLRGNAFVRRAWRANLPALIISAATT